MGEVTAMPHNLILDNRKKLSLTGITDVLGFNEENVSLITSMGALYVRGQQLHISKLNLDTGEVDIEGVINSLQYTDSKSSKSLLQRLFS